MGAKIIGLSRDLIIHPGETIADILEERGITQSDLAISAGVTAAYVSNVISGKKDISAKFAQALEYVLGVPKSFWLNLQAKYDAELLEFNAAASITDEERAVRRDLNDAVECLTESGVIGKAEKLDESILELRKVLRVSNLSNLKNIVPKGRLSEKVKGDSYKIGAWIKLDRILRETRASYTVKNKDRVVAELKDILI